MSNSQAAFSGICETLLAQASKVEQAGGREQALRLELSAVIVACCARNYDRAFSIYRVSLAGEKDFCFPLEVHLRVLQLFFIREWTETVPGLTSLSQARLYEEVGYLLQTQGRLLEARECKERAIEIYNDRLLHLPWTDAARSNARLSQLLLLKGEVRAAITTAKTAVKHAAMSGESSQKVLAQVQLANALWQLGEFTEATKFFNLAQMYAELRDFSAYLYLEFLLAQGQYDDAWTWVQVLRNSPQRYVVGLVAVLEAIFDERSGRSAHARSEIVRGVNLVRDAGRLDQLPRALLHRARWYMSIGQFEGAQADLNEAFNVVSVAGMRLYEVDIHIERARLALLLRHIDRFQQELELVKHLIAATGYRRRLGAIAKLERELNPTR